jgi:tRNA 2-selenouridine synthase
MNISPEQLIDILLNADAKLIDVRSEAEFARGHIPGAHNIPILNNDHRHQVGLCYKTHGVEQATTLGFALVEPIRAGIISRWKAYAAGQAVYVHCWRGGLRSSIAAQWMRESGIRAITVDGGYRGIRNLLLSTLKSQFNFLVLTGLTGVGKTPLLNRLPDQHRIDLESLASHRGSAFGGFEHPQPTQQNFENALAFMLSSRRSFFAIEDESRMIGKLQIPKDFFVQMQAKPLVLLQASIEYRVQNIYNEYIRDSNKSHDRLAIDMLQSLNQIYKRLGDAMHRTISQTMEDAFSHSSVELHYQWIEMLLKFYYDPRYSERLDKVKHRVVFAGTGDEVAEFLVKRS